MVLVEAGGVCRDGADRLAAQVVDAADAEVQLADGEEGGEVGGVGVCEDEDEEGVGGGDDAGGQGGDAEDVDGEGVGDAVPHRLLDAPEDVELAEAVTVDAPVAGVAPQGGCGGVTVRVCKWGFEGAARGGLGVGGRGGVIRYRWDGRLVGLMRSRGAV